MAHARGRALGVRPLARAATPRYPTFEAFAAEPALLMRYVPPRWRRCRIALAALAAFALGRIAAAGEGGALASEAKASVAPQPKRPRTARSARQVAVAPVFVHGEGRGATGCVAIAPPVFLSEAEALEILWDELEDASLGFERSPRVASLRPQEAGARPLVFDFWSPSLRLGVTFVGEHNYEALAGRAANAVESPDGGIAFSTVGAYDTLAVAQRTAERLRQAHADSAAVLYDPLVHAPYGRRDDGPEATHNELRAQARELLRAQVRDFVDWARTRLAPAAGER
jgi:hypothetical protein